MLNKILFSKQFFLLLCFCATLHIYTKHPFVIYIIEYYRVLYRNVTQNPPHRSKMNITLLWRKFWHFQKSSSSLSYQLWDCFHIAFHRTLFSAVCSFHCILWNLHLECFGTYGLIAVYVHLLFLILLLFCYLRIRCILKFSKIVLFPPSPFRISFFVILSIHFVFSVLSILNLASFLPFAVPSVRTKQYISTK